MVHAFHQFAEVRLNYQFIASEGATIASTVTYLLPVIVIVLGVEAVQGNLPAACEQQRRQHGPLLR